MGLERAPHFTRANECDTDDESIDDKEISRAERRFNLEFDPSCGELMKETVPDDQDQRAIGLAPPVRLGAAFCGPKAFDSRAGTPDNRGLQACNVAVLGPGLR